MKLHNILESYIIKRVHALYEDFSKSNVSFVSCSCKNCRLETLCYALNHIQPRYVVSGRGVSNTYPTLSNQIKTDIDVAIIEGMRVTNSAKRPYHWKSTDFFSSPVR